MPIVPETRVGKLEFYEAHLAFWTENALAIGLTPAAVAALAQRAAEARAAYTAHRAAQDAARSATLDFYLKLRALHAAPGAGADLLAMIKVHAQITDDRDVYALAAIPVPARPGRAAPPPGTPHGFAADLRPDGALRLRWKCDNPDGTVGTLYEILRSIEDGPFTFLGNAGVKSFVDATLPAGSAAAMYQITAIRSTVRSAAARFGVNLGVPVVETGAARETGAALPADARGRPVARTRPAAQFA